MLEFCGFENFREVEVYLFIVFFWFERDSVSQLLFVRSEENTKSTLKEMDA